MSACFVSCCANECGVIDAGVIPKFAGYINGVNWFKERDQWADNSAEFAPGMIIFFDWNDPDEGGQDGLHDYVGIVENIPLRVTLAIPAVKKAILWVITKF